MPPEDERSLDVAHSFIEAQSRAMDLMHGVGDRNFVEALFRALELQRSSAGARAIDTKDSRRFDALLQHLVCPENFVQGLLDQISWGFRTSNGDISYSLAFSLLRTPGLSHIGHLLLGAISARRRLWQMARDAYARCDDSLLVAYQGLNAIEAFTRSGEDRARSLVQRIAVDPGVCRDLSNGDAAFRIGSLAAAHGMDDAFRRLDEARARANPADTVEARWTYLRAAFERQQRVAGRLGTTGFFDTFDKAAWAPGAPAPVPGETVRIGLFDYRNPTFPSNNIGDYIQTIAVAGQLGQFSFERLSAPANVLSIVERRTGDRHSVSRPVEIVPVNRDFSLTTLDDRPIWLPVCGWFAHQPYFFGACLPFARNVNPIFMSFHLARPEQASPRVVDYLKAHEPIGCRDMLTVRYLRDLGVQAFFNGCVTLSLGATFTPFEGTRKGHFQGEYKAGASASKEFEVIEHLDTGTWNRDFDETIGLARDLLDTYRQAESVRTPLLHCLLPSRAMGTPVSFTHPNLSDPRFEGLVEASDDERARIVERFETKFRLVMEQVLAGAERDQVFSTWRALCREDIEETDRRIAAAAPRPSQKDDYDAFRDFAPRRVGPEAPVGTGETIDIVFCFDGNFIDHFAPTFASITANTQRPLRVHLICREVDIEAIEAIAGRFPETSFSFYDVTKISYGDVKLLSHISVSTMDRLVSPILLSDVDHAVYLDIDILLRGDVAELADFDLGGHCLAARDSIHEEWKSGRSLVYDIAKRFDAETANEFRAFMFDGGRVEFVAYNAGVLVMDLFALRRDNFTAKAIDWVKRFGLHDQFILNIYTRERRATLPPEWNHFATQEIMDDPKLVHFIGTIKPWTGMRRHPFDREWLAYRDDVAEETESARIHSRNPAS